jgi:hypothetical protein
MENTQSKAALRLLTIAAWQTQCIRAAIELGLPDHLAAGPATSEELAVACGAQERPLRRLMRALVAMGVLDVDAGQRYSLTQVGEELGPDGPGPFALTAGSEPAWSAWTALTHSIRTGGCAFEHVHGMPAWEYLASHPDEGTRFRTGMAALTRGVGSRVVSSYDFSRFPVVVDVGGGDGALLAEILRQCPQGRGILVDLPHVVPRAEQALDQAGVSDRCDFWAGDFRAGLPSGDAFVLKSILHDWQDDDVLAILGSCRNAAAPDSRLLIVERVLPEEITGGDLEAMLTDLNMLVMLGGLERTGSEHRRLLDRGGFRLDRVVPTGTEFSVIEASVVPA